MKSYTDEYDMMALLSEITPLSRTLANDETDKAFNVLKNILPGSKVEGFPTGSKAWTWTIPQRWEVNKATIKANNETLVDLDWNPLHVINYSQPFKGIVTKEELVKHLVTNPQRPKAIPFSFSFYEKI